jgi:osmotically-inducible protein OsmY
MSKARDKDKTIEAGPDRSAPRKIEQREEEIRGNVLDALSNSPRVSSIAAITIRVDRDVVRLSGQVDDQEAKEEAEALTINVPGVNKVENDLIVMAPTPLGQFPSRVANLPPEQ